jgi:hypothetical protein
VRRRASLGGAILLLACCAGAMPAGTALADLPAMRQWNFNVYLDDREVGYHRFRLNDSADGMRLETHAKFTVKMFLLTVFAYEHHNTEFWRDGCLQRIESRTDSNGEYYQVNGVARDGELLVSNEVGEQRLDGCVTTFAYWDRRLLERGRLLNAQTGEYQPVALKPLGPGSLVLGERTIAVQRYALTANKMDIELAYAADGGEWVALDSRLEQGRVLQYRRDPGDLRGPGGAAALADNLPLE